MNRTPIEYLTHTWNPIAMRCTPCSPGCANCWHLKRADMLAKNGTLKIPKMFAYAGGKPVLDHNKLEAPSKLRKRARIGVQFMGDLFHESVDSGWRYLVVKTAYDLRHRHDFLFLTKRPENMFSFFTDPNITGYCSGVPFIDNGTPPASFLLGLTICTQAEYDEKMPVFIQIPGRKWLSIEPMLEFIDLTPPQCRGTNLNQDDWLEELDGIVLGGETGPGARPLNPEWVRYVRDRCINRTDLGRPWSLPFFFKQWGEWVTAEQGYPTGDEKQYVWEDGRASFGVGKKAAGRLLDGREWNEYPE